MLMDCNLVIHSVIQTPTGSDLVIRSDSRTLMDSSLETRTETGSGFRISTGLAVCHRTEKRSGFPMLKDYNLEIPTVTCSDSRMLTGYNLMNRSGSQMPMDSDSVNRSDFRMQTGSGLANRSGFQMLTGLSW